MSTFVFGGNQTVQQLITFILYVVVFHVRAHVVTCFFCSLDPSPLLLQGRGVVIPPLSPLLCNLTPQLTESLHHMSSAERPCPENHGSSFSKSDFSPFASLCWLLSKKCAWWRPGNVLLTTMRDKKTAVFTLLHCYSVCTSLWPFRSPLSKDGVDVCTRRIVSMFFFYFLSFCKVASSLED